MYGLINISIKNLVKENYGQEKWNQILADAGLKDDTFISNKTYDDKITYDLVGASAKALNVASDEVLKMFGRYWVLNVATKAYGKLLDAGGSTFEEFLINLPNFHTRVMLIYPKVKPPHFEVVKIDNKCLKLIYSSERVGLLPFVVGLIEGLATRFSIQVKIDYAGQSNLNGSHEFSIVRI